MSTEITGPTHSYTSHQFKRFFMFIFTDWEIKADSLKLDMVPRCYSIDHYSVLLPISILNGVQTEGIKDIFFKSSYYDLCSVTKLLNNKASLPCNLHVRLYWSGESVENQDMRKPYKIDQVFCFITRKPNW